MIDHTRMLSQRAEKERHKIPLTQADIAVEKNNGKPHTEKFTRFPHGSLCC